MLANSMTSEFKFLKSNENLNKNGVRNLIKLEDITFKTFVRGIKAIATPLEDVEQIEAFVYKATEKYIERLRVEELLVEKNLIVKLKQKLEKIQSKKNIIKV